MDSISKLLTLCPLFEIDIPLDTNNGDPLKVQVIVNGRSPAGTIHWTDASSPAWIGSEPNVNGTTDGKTKKKIFNFNRRKVIAWGLERSGSAEIKYIVKSYNETDINCTLYKLI